MHPYLAMGEATVKCVNKHSPVFRADKEVIQASLASIVLYLAFVGIQFAIGRLQQ